MRKLSVIFVVILPLISFGQNNPPFKNEIGVDITALIEQVLNFNPPEFFTPYSATYQGTYKRHLDDFSVRVGIGIRGNNENLNINSVEDERIRNRFQLDYRIGIERQIVLSNRWNFFFGLDYRSSRLTSMNNFGFQNGGWRVGSEFRSISNGLAPLIGIDFRINERIMLQTEASLYGFISNETETPIVTPINNNPGPNMPSTEVISSKRSGIRFIVPNFLVLSIRL